MWSTKKVSKNGHFLTFFPKGKKGMEMELIVKLIILILFLFLVGILYVALKGQGEGFLDKLLNLF